MNHKESKPPINILEPESFNSKKYLWNALGPIAMKYKLKPFLDSEELTNEIILAAYSKINIKDVIKKLVSKFEKNKIALDNKLKNEIINKLRRKGHYWDDINEVIQEYVSS